MDERADSVSVTAGPGRSAPGRGTQRGRPGGRRRFVAASLVAALIVGACTGGDDTQSDVSTPDTSDTGPTGPSSTGPGSRGAASGDDPAAVPLGLRLGEGSAAAGVEAAVQVVDGEPLTADDVAAVLARLPEWDVPDDDVADFRRPPDSPPPPLVGDTVDQPFPPAGEPEQVEVPSGPLEVLRFQPDGEVDVAPFLSVTFDRPMVPVATLDQLADIDVPVTVTPDIDGRWRWIGTRTLRFELEPGEIDRLPAATEYQVEVPAGTRSADGSELADAVTWTFSTPPPQLRTFVGDSRSLPLEPVFVAVFDQRVDPESVIDSITLTAGGEDHAVRQATAEEVDADEDARRAVAAALDGRAVAFRPADALPAATGLTIAVGPGTPSAEGPRVTEEATTYDAHTFDAFDVRTHTCGHRRDRACDPSSSFVIEMRNPVDLDAFDADMVSVDPEIPGLRVDVYGEVIEISGAIRARTTYTVTLAAELRDVFGQSLGEDTTVEFEVGAAQQMLRGFNREWVTVDPGSSSPQVGIATVNHDSVSVEAWAVTPDDAAAFQTHLEARWSDVDPPMPDWPQVIDTVVEIDGDDDVMIDTAIDLADGFAQSGSQLVVRIAPTAGIASDQDRWNNRPIVAWVQATTLAVDVIADDDELLIWTTDLRTGEPVGDVTVALLGSDVVVSTDADGLARAELTGAGVYGLHATAGDRTAFAAAPWGDRWQRQDRGHETRWFVFGDRGVYRPGETARLTGWVRQLDRDDDARLALYDDGTEVRYQAWDPQGNELAEGTVTLNALGGFHLAIEIPDDANLGEAWVEITVEGASATWSRTAHHGFQVQEFRRPEFEVTTRQVTPAPHHLAEPVTVATDATYYAGGPLADAEVQWLVSTGDTTYRPPDWDDFQFGRWQPWWWHGGGWRGAATACIGCWPDGNEYEEYAGRTDAHGTHHLEIGFDASDVDLPRSVTAEATVFDLNRQGWASRTDLLVHPANVYVGLRSDRNFVDPGAPLVVHTVVTDIDGASVEGYEIDVTAGRVVWTPDGWDQEVVDEQTCTITSVEVAPAPAGTTDAGDESMRCEFATEVGGQYRVTAVVTDDDGHRNRTEITQWVSGGPVVPDRSIGQDEVVIVPDSETYEPGDTAELLVQAPFAPAYGLMTIVRNGIVSEVAFDAADGSAVVEVPIDDAHIPNLTVQVDMVGAAPRTAPDGTDASDASDRPAFATGQIALRIPPISRTLDVTATPDDAMVEPGADTSVTVEVAGPDGAAVEGAGVAVVVIDEAVLALTGYELADPLDAFYADIWADVYSHYARAGVMLARPDAPTGVDEAEAEAGASDASAPDALFDADTSDAAGDGATSRASQAATADAIELRSDFEPLAVYAPDETTGADGTVTVDIDLPDNLTRYRVMAVAVDGADHFGSGESTITARLPVMVRPSAPRFANFGDRFELPVIVQNQTDEALEVSVVVEAANLSLDGTGGRQVTVRANDRVEVRFPVETDSAGTARYRVAAVSGEMSDAAAGELPVYTPATAEAFATYGVIDDGAVAQSVLQPDGVFPQFGGLEINTSSTALQALTDAVISIVDHRFESAGGYSSRIISIAALRDVLDAFDADGLPSPAEIDAQVQLDAERLAALQNSDGGFPYWRRGERSIPWMSVRSAHALVVADRAGYEVPSDALAEALGYVSDIERHLTNEYGEGTRHALIAYALHVRHLSGDTDTAAATDLYRRAGDDLQLDALAWLWPLITDDGIHSEIERTMGNRATETAGVVTFATDYGEDAYLIAHSDRRTDGIVLEALITEAPDSDLIPRAVAGLLGDHSRRPGGAVSRWDDVHANVFILLALHRYFETYEAVTPDFVARVWLGDDYVAEHEMHGRTTDRLATLVPMGHLVDGDLFGEDASGEAPAEPLMIHKDGDGRLYYRIGLRYAPDDLELAARDEGFVVERVYEAVDDPADVRLDDDGTWHVRAGATVRVRLTMVADARRTHVALIDALPAGLEPLNPALAVSSTIRPDDPDDGSTGDDDHAGSVVDSDWAWCWCWNWFEHQNLRDDRVEAFTSYLPAGTYEYVYEARATTPGEFVVPPTRAEEMYAPEVFGRSASTRVVVG